MEETFLFKYFSVTEANASELLENHRLYERIHRKHQYNEADWLIIYSATQIRHACNHVYCS